MIGEPISRQALVRQIEELQARLQAAEAIVQAIQTHEVDALVIKGPQGEQVYTLAGADHPYRVLVETMNEGAVTLGTDGTILYCNRSFAQLLGVPLEQLLGARITSLIAPHDRLLFEDLIEQAEAGTAKGEIVLQSLGGRPIPAYLSLSALVLEEMPGICMVVTNLTEQKRNVEIVKAGHLARAILEQATEAIVVCDPEGRILRASHKAYELAGKALHGQSFFESFALSLGSDGPLPWATGSRSNGKIAVASLLDWCKGHNLLQRDITLTRPDGQIRAVLLSAAPLYGDDPAMLGCVITLTDISARKRIEDSRRASEERFRNLFEHAPLGIAITDWEGRLQQCNPAYCAMLGYTSEELKRRVFAELVHPDDRAANLAEIHRLQTGEVPFFQIENRYVRKDGQPVWVHKFVSILRDDTGAPVHLMALVTDVTERHCVETALREADRRKDDFLAVLAHELRNPLAPIRNAVSILRHQGTSDPHLQWCRDVIDRQVEQMARLLDDLLDVSRISRGKLELRKERLQLAAVMRQALETSRPPIEMAGHELTVAMPAEPLFLEADPVRLAQVFSNLLNNAAKYTERGGHIWLTVEPVGNEARISLRDTGIGIPANQLQHIFEPFMQRGESLERSQGGLGVGLALAQQLVRMHDGRIEAHSAGAGQGSEFIIYLPLAVAAPATAVPSAIADQKSAPTRLRLLVVDDNKDATNSLSMLLQVLGHEVSIAYDGLEAVTTAATFHPDVVLLDLGMPKLDGYEAARRIRAQPWGKQMILIALTGWGQEGDRRRTQAAGFDYHLVKPVDPEALKKLLAGLPAARGGHR